MVDAMSPLLKGDNGTSSPSQMHVDSKSITTVTCCPYAVTCYVIKLHALIILVSGWAVLSRTAAFVAIWSVPRTFSRQKEEVTIEGKAKNVRTHLLPSQCVDHVSSYTTKEPAPSSSQEVTFCDNDILPVSSVFLELFPQSHSENI